MEGRTERTQGIVTIINMQQSIKERTVLAKEQQLQAHRKDLVERCVGQVREGEREGGGRVTGVGSFAVRRLNDV